MSNQHLTPHDSYFKTMFSKKENALDFLRNTLPLEIVERLDLESLKLDSTNYVDENLQEYFADVVYNCDYNDEDKTKNVKVTFLFEHKSYVEHIPYLQLLRYMLNIWDNRVKQSKKDKEKLKDILLQPIIPIIFYHGKSGWKVKPFETYFTVRDKNLQSFLPMFKYHMIDLSQYPDSEITKRFQNGQLRAVLLLMKKIFYEQQLLDFLRELFSTHIEFKTQTEENQFYKSATYYIFSSTKKDLFNKIKELMETINTNQSENFVSIADMLIMQGEERGIEKEKRQIAISMIIKGYPDIEIMELTGLTQEQVLQLRRQNNRLGNKF